MPIIKIIIKEGISFFLKYRKGRFRSILNSFFPYLSLNLLTNFSEDNPSPKKFKIPLFVIFDKFI